MRQLVSALELRFNQLEIDSRSLFDTDPLDGAGTGEYAPLDHTHTESEITDLGIYLTDISGESIFDLSDVSGTPSTGQILVWNGAAFTPQAQGAASLALNDLTNVSAASPSDEDVLTFDTGTNQWVASPAAGASTTLSSLTDTNLTGQQQYDLLYNVDGTNWTHTAGELSWDATLGALVAIKMIAGDPGTEGTGITVNGTNYESELKVSDIGAVNAAEFILHRHSTTLPALMIGARAKTDDATHAVMADNDVLMTFLAAGWDGVDSYSLSSEIRMEVDGTPGQDDMPGQITFMTSADGTETPVERMRIRSAGNVEMDNGLDVTGNITVTGTVDGIDIFTDVTANNAKVTNATHTGEVTGATTLAVDPLAITNKTDVVADAADDALISDDDDAGNLKKVNLSSITDGGFF